VNRGESDAVAACEHKKQIITHQVRFSLPIFTLHKHFILLGAFRKRNFLPRSFPLRALSLCSQSSRLVMMLSSSSERRVTLTLFYFNALRTFRIYLVAQAKREKEELTGSGWGTRTGSGVTTNFRLKLLSMSRRLMMKPDDRTARVG
jgi:hypothetical protein